MCVLLVEDEWLIRSIMAESLMDAGFDVIQAGSADEAFERLERETRGITVLVTDVHLPGSRTGLEVAEEMRRRIPELPVIVATGRPDVLGPDWRLAGASPYFASRMGRASCWRSFGPPWPGDDRRGRASVPASPRFS